METIATIAAALDQSHIRTALGKSVLAEYGNGSGPLAVANVEIARAMFAYAAQAEIEALTTEEQHDIAV